MVQILSHFVLFIIYLFEKNARVLYFKTVMKPEYQLYNNACEWALTLMCICVYVLIQIWKKMKIQQI